MVTLPKVRSKAKVQSSLPNAKKIPGRVFLKNQGRFLELDRSEIIGRNEMQAAFFRYSFAYTIRMDKIMQ
jgi:hypothetical protein